MTISLEEVTSRLPLSAEEFVELQVPEGTRLELWNGNLDMAAAAQMYWHSAVANRILQVLLRSGRRAARETGVVLAPRTVRAPDVSRFREGIKPALRGSQFPAEDVDLVVEVVSPESEERDRLVKPHEYARAGIPEFWVAEEHPDDAEEALINIYRLTPGLVGNTYTLIRQLSLAEIEAEA